MAADFSAMKLGLKPPNPELLAHLPGMMRLGVALPQARPVMDWGRAIQPTTAWGMDLNDAIGNCTIASVDHARRLWCVNSGRTFAVPTSNELIAAYSAVSGYDPTNPSTDQGAHWTDVLSMWRRSGFRLGATRDRIAGFVSLNLANDNELRLGVQWFGCAMAGVALPLSAQQQRVWDVVPGPEGEVGSWGGHAIPIVGYDPDTISFVSWGQLMRMTWRFARRYLMEAYAVLSADWIERSGSSPGGIKLAALQSDLAEMAA